MYQAGDRKCSTEFDKFLLLKYSWNVTVLSPIVNVLVNLLRVK